MSVYRVGLYRWSFEVYIPATQSRTGKAIRARKRVLLKGVPEANALAHMHKLARETEAELRNAGANILAPRKRRSQSVNVENDQPPPPQENTARRPTPKPGDTLRAALLLAWDCPNEGLARTKDGERSYKHAAECIGALGATMPCAYVDGASYAYLIQHFTGEGMTHGAANKRVAALHRVLHFAAREGWIKRRPYGRYWGRFANPIAPAFRTPT